MIYVCMTFGMIFSFFSVKLNSVPAEKAKRQALMRWRTASDTRVTQFIARSAENCREMMERADADENDGVSYNEFVEWLERNDPGRTSLGFQEVLCFMNLIASSLLKTMWHFCSFWFLVFLLHDRVHCNKTTLLFTSRKNKPDLRQHNHPEILRWGALEKSLMTDADLVRATFRLWDKDGNGVVSKQENRTDAWTWFGLQISLALCRSKVWMCELGNCWRQITKQTCEENYSSDALCMFCFEMRMKDSKSLNWRPIFLFEAFSKFSKHAVQWFNDIRYPRYPRYPRWVYVRSWSRWWALVAWNLQRSRPWWMCSTLMMMEIWFPGFS